MGEDEFDKGWARMNPRSSCEQKNCFWSRKVQIFTVISPGWLLKTMLDLFK